MKRIWTLLLVMCLATTMLLSSCTSRAERQEPDLDALLDAFVLPGTSADAPKLETDGQGLPAALVNEIGKAVYTGQSDAYISGMHDASLSITVQDFVFQPHQDAQYPEDQLVRALAEGAAGCSFYKYDINGEGADELLVVTQSEYEYSYSNRAYILTETGDGYEYANVIYLSHYRLFAVFSYHDKLYILANYDDYNTRTTKAVGLFAIDGTENPYIYIRKANDGYRFHELYHNDYEPLADDVQAYADEIGIDLIYTDRIHQTFYGDETNRDDLLPEARENNDDRIFWNIYAAEVGNDGKEMFFDRKILYRGGSDMTETTVTWYDPETRQVVPAAFEVWRPTSFYLTQQWFKTINGKTVIFSLYHKRAEDVYLLDARMLEENQTTILLDYVIDLNVTVELAAYWDYEETNLEPVTYNDPDHDQAFPDTIRDWVADLSARVQGEFSAAAYPDDSIPHDLIVLLEQTLFTDNNDYPALDLTPLEVRADDFYDQYKEDLDAPGRNDFNKYIQHTYRYRLDGQTYYLTVEDSGGTARFVSVTIYKVTDGGLVTCDFLTSLDFDARVIAYEEELYYVEWLYNYNSKYRDRANVCRLTADGFGESVSIAFLPEEYEYEMIYSGDSPAEPAITKYVDSVMDDLMAKSSLDDSIERYTGEESNRFDHDKLLRLQSVGGINDYYEIDFDNDGTAEYLSKQYWYPTNALRLALLCDVYRFTDTRTVETGQSFTDSERVLLQVWFQEIEGKVYTFRLFSEIGYHYVLNVSLIEGSDITQIQSYIVVSKRAFALQAGETAEERRIP
ncbi:MAG: hypothetical protein LIO58_05785 [Oscillospiraceae bacterium]|nr:hypothetical protein [Oscillospiraceae bacterium]